ncbi:MAG: hypothetical protein HKN68_07440 [Saprospiraceae bacterium]|nr:hypothetical protein [Saprospiraceae bacterium]
MTKLQSHITKILSLFIFLSFSGLQLNATDGYLSNGIGVQYKSFAGAGVAFKISPLGAATNPASLAFLDTGYDINISIFNPRRDFEVVGNPSQIPGTFGLAPGKVESSSEMFFIPALAANWKWGANKSIGLAFYGNGGMNTNYESPVFGMDPTGVDLQQMFLQPTIAFLFAEKHSIGISPIIAYQRFKAEGLGAFGMFSSNPAALTDNGYSSSTGFGARIGYIGDLHEMVSVGLSYQTAISMGEFEEYAGLYAEGGGFDIPQNWTAGVVFNAMLMEIAFDVKKIYYSDIQSIANPMLPNLMQAPLGMDGAAGFGWEDVMVYKIGINYPVNEKWILRAGYSFGDQPVQESEVMFNILAPGVIEQHITFGFSRIINYENELSFFVMRGVSNNVVGANPLDPPSGQTIDLRMDQWEFGMGYTF